MFRFLIIQTQFIGGKDKCGGKQRPSQERG